LAVSLARNLATSGTFTVASPANFDVSWTCIVVKVVVVFVVEFDVVSVVEVAVVTVVLVEIMVVVLVEVIVDVLVVMVILVLVLLAFVMFARLPSSKPTTIYNLSTADEQTRMWP
jgi:hypothetical protein